MAEGRGLQILDNNTASSNLAGASTVSPHVFLMNRAIPVHRVTTHAHLRASDGPRLSRFEGQGFENRVHDLNCHLTRLGAGPTLEILMTENRSEKADVRAYASRRNIKYTEALRAFSPAPAFRLPTADEWETFFVRNRTVGTGGLPPMFLHSVPSETVARVTFQIPLGLKIEDVEHALPILRTLSHCALISLGISNDPTRFTLTVAESILRPPVIPFQITDDGPIPIGVRDDSSQVFLTQDSAPNILISGRSGAGKTMALRGMIANYRARGGVIRVITSGTSMLSELGVFSEAESATSLIAAAAMLDSILSEVCSRPDLSHGPTLDSGEGRPKGARPPQTLIAVDGLFDRPYENNGAKTARLLSDVVDQLEQISKQGAVSGIRVVLTVQRGYDAMVFSRLADEMARLVIGSTSDSELDEALRKPKYAPKRPASEGGARHGIWEPLNGLPQLIGMFTIPAEIHYATAPQSNRN